MTFLKDIMTLNHFDVRTTIEIKKEPTDPETYIVGVTDLLFNPVIYVYEKKASFKDRT